MPDRVTGVQIVPDSGPNPVNCTIQVGPNGYGGISIASLFNRTQFDVEQLKGNIRLKHLIGGYGALWSDEFLAAFVAGVRLSDADYYNLQFDLNQDNSHRITFGNTRGGQANQSVDATDEELTGDTHDDYMVVRNVKSFLRIDGYTDLTTPAASGIHAGLTAVQAVQLWTFRY